MIEYDLISRGTVVTISLVTGYRESNGQLGDSLNECQNYDDRDKTYYLHKYPQKHSALCTLQVTLFS